jgi:protein-ribulosamine 3-kinase
MSLSTPLITHIEQLLSAKITNTHPVSGGSINKVYGIETANRKYLLKFNSKSKYRDMFACEVKGLKAIRSTKTILTPDVIFTGELHDDTFLILEWIESRRPTAAASALLGKQLAQMHKQTAKSFGFDSDNYMGSLRQSNKRHATWTSFYVNERLMPMVKIAVDQQVLTAGDVKDFESLYNKLANLFGEELPSLIHGDLWAGNYLISIAEKPFLIDPAVSYGNREFDIAMTTLFGGFVPEFYAAYEDEFPLNSGWQQRVDLWNLYPLLLHLNLFGTGYLQQVRNAVKKFC